MVTGGTLLAPGWPEVVEEVMRCLEDLRQCEAGPDPLSAEHAVYGMLAGLKAVFRTHVCVLARGEGTWLAGLLESTVRDRQLWRTRGRGRP